MTQTSCLPSGRKEKKGVLKLIPLEKRRWKGRDKVRLSFWREKERERGGRVVPVSNGGKNKKGREIKRIDHDLAGREGEKGRAYPVYAAQERGGNAAKPGKDARPCSTQEKKGKEGG